MRGRIVVLAGAALLVGTVSGADDTNRLRAIGEGRALFVAHCASCHGADARGATAPDLTAMGSRHGTFSALHAANHVTGRRDGLDGGTMPCWGRVLVRRWPGGEGPAALQTWKLAKYLEFVQGPRGLGERAAIRAGRSGIRLRLLRRHARRPGGRGGGVRPVAAAASREFRVSWQEREVALVEGENLLGRVHEAVVWVEHPSVSRRHALIRVAGGTAMLEDCGSKNGTFLRGERIDAPRELNAGDEICLGQARLHFGVYSPDVSTRSDDRTVHPA